MVGDIEAAFITWLDDGSLTGFTVLGETDPAITCCVPYRAGGPTDSGTFLDHPLMVVDLFGSEPPGQTSKSAVARAAGDALTRALSMKGQTVNGVVVTDVVVTSGIQNLPEPSGRWHYQFMLAVTCHPTTP